MEPLHFIFDNSLYRFIVVGISNTIIGYLVFVGCYYFLFTDDASTSQFFSYASGIVWSFYWNRKWTFKRHDNSTRRFLLFLVTQLVFLGLSVSMVHLVVDVLKMNPTLGWVFIMAIITILNYTSNKYVVFRET